MIINTQEDYDNALRKYDIMKDHYQDNDEQKEFIALAESLNQYELGLLGKVKEKRK